MQAAPREHAYLSRVLPIACLHSATFIVSSPSTNIVSSRLVSQPSKSLKRLLGQHVIEANLEARVKHS